jgi:hypothetical protein
MRSSLGGSAELGADLRLGRRNDVGRVLKSLPSVVSISTREPWRAGKAPVKSASVSSVTRPASCMTARQGRIVEEMDSRTATEQRIMYAAVH